MELRMYVHSRNATLCNLFWSSERGQIQANWCRLRKTKDKFVNEMAPRQAMHPRMLKLKVSKQNRIRRLLRGSSVPSVTEWQFFPWCRTGPSKSIDCVCKVKEWDSCEMDLSYARKQKSWGWANNEIILLARV